MIYLTSVPTSGKGVIIPQESLKNCCDYSVTTCKYISTGTLSGLVGVKVTHKGVVTTFTKPSSVDATSVSEVTQWLEDEIKALGWYIFGTEYNDYNFPEIYVQTTGITMWGQLALTSVDYGSGYVAASAYCTKYSTSCYKTTLGATDNNFIVAVNGTNYEVVSGQVIPGTTAAQSIEDAIVAAIAAVVATVPTVDVTYNALEQVYYVKFTGVVNGTEITVNGSVAEFCGSTQDFKV